MNVLGLKIANHDTGAALIAHGRVVAVSEERLNRVKHSFNMFPTLAIDYCLAELGLTPAELDLIVIDQTGVREEAPMKEIFARETGARFAGVRVEVINHHDAHAASAFFCSPFSESAVLVYDGSGERFLTQEGVVVETETLYQGRDNTLTELQKVRHLRDGRRATIGIGKVYSLLSSSYLGFGNYNEGKMMGLAPFGDLSLLKKIPEHRWWKEVDGEIVCNAQIFPAWRIPLIGGVLAALWHRARLGSSVFAPIILPRPARAGEQLPDKYYASVARTAQHVLEAVAVALGLKLKTLTGSDNLAIAGGIGLNIDANKNFLDKAGFKRLFVQPGSSDSGVPLGCALWGYHVLLKQPRFWEMKHAYLGRAYSTLEVEAALDAFKDKVRWRRSATIAKDAAALLADGKVGAWFQGGSEYGPRALGHRSIIADARRPDMADTLNYRVKHREAWRPFATSMLKDKLGEWFDLAHESPYMLLAAQALPGVAAQVPSVIHVDNTSRIQTVTKEDNGRYFELIDEFYKLTGVPIILNTSFNLGGEPIVESPQDALRTFTSTDMDYLVLEEYLVEKL